MYLFRCVLSYFGSLHYLNRFENIVETYRPPLINFSNQIDILINCKYQNGVISLDGVVRSYFTNNKIELTLYKVDYRRKKTYFDIVRQNYQEKYKLVYEPISFFSF